MANLIITLTFALSYEYQVIRDEEAGTESAVISLGAGVRKRVTLNTHAVMQKNQVSPHIFYPLLSSPLFSSLFSSSLLFSPLLALNLSLTPLPLFNSQFFSPQSSLSPLLLFLIIHSPHPNLSSIFV
jgi:hypothetical protein